MKELEQKILAEGKVLPGNVLKVGSFLNQQIDTALTGRMGKEIASLYRDALITKVVTIETSGIPFAYAIASELGVPMIFAKKETSSNVGGSVYTAPVHSYTHNKDYEIVISKEYLHETDNILLADDFLACGNALRGLLQICRAAGARVVGCAIEIEKGFQGGGDALRAEGIRVDSLALIDSLADGKVTFRA